MSGSTEKAAMHRLARLDARDGARDVRPSGAQTVAPFVTAAATSSTQTAVDAVASDCEIVHRR